MGEGRVAEKDGKERDVLAPSEKDIEREKGSG